MKRLALLSLSVLLLSGCVTGLAGSKNLPAITGDNFANIYFMRKPGFIGGGQAATIELNSEKLFYLNQGHCAHFAIPAGKAKLSAVIYGGWLPVPGPNRRRIIDFEAVKGKVTFSSLTRTWGSARSTSTNFRAADGWRIVPQIANG